MKKSKLAIASFILSFMPIIVPFLLLLDTVITFPGTPIGTVEPLEIVDGEIVGGGEIKDTGETASLKGITISGLFASFGYILFGLLPFTSLFLVISIILGTIALIKVKRNNVEGKWFAIAGIAMSIILIIMFITFYIYSGGKGVA